MSFLLLLTLLIGTTNGSQIGQHLIRFKNERSSGTVGIINGNKTAITKRPYMASLSVDGDLFGSGTILSQNWILTTAFNVAWCDPATLEFRVGSSSYNKGGQALKVDKVIIHENYTGTWDWDVAVVKVTKPIKYSKKAKKIALGTNDLAGGVKAVISGWGESNKAGTPSSTLLDADVTVMDWNACSQTYKSELTSRLMCTFDSNLGPCLYDYGDPLVFENAVYGLYAGADSCIPGSNPVLYTDIPPLSGWIQNAIKN